MDYHLKQWGNQQHESDDHHHHHQLQHQQQQQQNPSGSALQLFVPDPEPPNNTKLSNNSNLSAFSDMSHISTPTTTASTRFPRMASSYFSLAQWQELELQALIFRYMLAGADVPDELLHPIKKSILQSHPSFNYHPLHHYPHYQSPLLQSGYWGRAAMDPEPGRCRRTDGKKWRCSRDVVAGHKYCERHMHRGRNRSRKPVETPTAPTASAPPLTTAVAAGGMSSSSHFALSGPSRPSIDLFQLNQSSSEPTMVENKSLFESQNENPSSGDHGRSDGKILRCFFDDWPRSLQEEPESVTGGNNASSMTSAPSSLSMSFPGNMSSSSDISLKLSTGTLDDEPGSRGDYIDRERTQLNWATAGWGTHPVAPMGGPLAEALRSSSTTSPTSVLHELPRNSTSETSYV